MTAESAASPSVASLDKTAVAALLPIRRISRLAHDMHLAGNGVLAQALTPRLYDRGIVLLVVMRICSPDWVVDGRLARPTAVTRFVSINSIAQSLQRPFETIRRHVHGLIASGICIATPLGVALNPERSPWDKPLTLIADLSDMFLQFAHRMTSFHLMPPATLPPSPSLLLDVVQAALDVSLMPFGRFGRLFTDWTAMRVWSCIGILNVHHIMQDPELDERFAYVSTPDGMRQPVTLRLVERTFGIPYATVWRHCQSLQKAGLVSETSEGWLVRQAQLRADEVEEEVVYCVLYYVRRLSLLARSGLNVAEPTAVRLLQRSDPDPATADVARIDAGRVPTAGSPMLWN